MDGQADGENRPGGLDLRVASAFQFDDAGVGIPDDPGGVGVAVAGLADGPDGEGATAIRRNLNTGAVQPFWPGRPGFVEKDAGEVGMAEKADRFVERGQRQGGHPRIGEIGPILHVVQGRMRENCPGQPVEHGESVQPVHAGGAQGFADGVRDSHPDGVFGNVGVGLEGLELVFELADVEVVVPEHAGRAGGAHAVNTGAGEGTVANDIATEGDPIHPASGHIFQHGLKGV